MHFVRPDVSLIREGWGRGKGRERGEGKEGKGVTSAKCKRQAQL